MPQIGAINLTAELSLVYDATELGGAAGIYTGFFGFRQGLEYNSLDDHLWFRLVADIVMRRGGLADHGERFRLDYEPSTGTLLGGLTLRWPFMS